MSRKWHKGPPPFPGWWNASTKRDLEAWRWFDGECWSYMAWPCFSIDMAENSARLKYPSESVDDIEWTHYYPKNARVPRIDPRKVK